MTQEWDADVLSEVRIYPMRHRSGTFRLTDHAPTVRNSQYSLPLRCLPEAKPKDLRLLFGISKLANFLIADKRLATTIRMKLRRLRTLDKNGILFALSQSDKTECGKDNFAEQSFPQKVFSSIWALEAEVNNGGFSQYFFNSSRETAGFVVTALKTINAVEMAELCKQAIDVAFPGGLPADLELIRLAAADFSDETEAGLRALDERFFDYPNDLTELLYRYVSEHPEEFGELPDLGAA